MFVLSRMRGESLVIDDLVVTVDAIAKDHSVFSVMRTNCEFLGRVTAPFNEYVEITDKVRVIMIRAERDKVRIGFDLPPNCRLARWKAWDPDRDR